MYCLTSNHWSSGNPSCCRRSSAARVSAAALRSAALYFIATHRTVRARPFNVVEVVYWVQVSPQVSWCDAAW